ncbi:MAG TPA: DEAD/DEAH box helicase [Haploplasma sp.]|nr:DEAD/DEAH box helicase [Haploplasma sp.]
MDYKKYLENMGFTDLSPIQSQTIKYFNNDKNLVGVAPTGTGKTHAYLLPLVANLNLTTDSVQAVILVPTNELVNQVRRMLDPLIDGSFKVKSYDSKIDKQREIKWLKNNQPQIVISTPERIIDLGHNGLSYNTAKYLILDEADMMFDEAFLTQIDVILSRLPNSKYMLFSATITEDMHTFIKKYFGSYNLIDTSKEHTLKITHKLVKSQLDNRDVVLKDILKIINPFLAIIFVSKKENQREVYDMLLDMDLNVGLLSADLNQHQRKNAINDILNLKYQYIVASDLASRGLDFDVSHVINYDLPYHLEFFKHRSGRTGRMNKEGEVITIALNSDRNKINRLAKSGFDFVDYRITKGELVVAVETKANVLSDAELNAMRKVKKPTRVKPNSRKKNREKILKAKQSARRKNNAKNR